MSSIIGPVDGSSNSPDAITLTEDQYENCLQSVNGIEERHADDDDEIETAPLNALDTVDVIPHLVLGAVSRSGRRTRPPAYLRQYCLQ